MRLRALPLLATAVTLLALAWSVAGLRAPLPTGDEATPVMIVQSLWHDHDLVYAEADLRRAERVWDGGPAGLTLFTSDGGKTLRYGRPLAYPLAALPFYGILGLRGIVLLNMALFLGMAGAAIWHLSGENGPAGLFAGGFFFASAALAYAFRLEPDVFVMACVFFPLLIWQRLRKAPGMDRNHLALLALAGVLLGVLLIQNPLAALLGLPVLADLAWRRRWRDFAAVALAVLLAAGALVLLQKGVTGEWTAFGGAQRRTFETAFPLQDPGDPWQGYRGETPDLNIAAGLRLLPRNLLYVFAGRHTGLLPYFPFALFALALYLWGPKDRCRHLLLAGLGGYVFAVLLLHPNDFAGGPGFLGSRYLVAIYPAFVLLPGRIGVRRSLLLPFAAAGLWTAVAVIHPLHAAAPAFQRLPLELTLLPGDHLPGFFRRTWGNALWIVPRQSFFAEENHPNGVWVRGGTRSEVIVVSPAPLPKLALTVYSLAADNELTLDSGAERLRVRFDTQGKRDGTPVEIALTPATRDLGFFPAAPRERVYRLTLETTAGLVPARAYRDNGDPRDLGVFLDFTGQGY
ncbi:MAG TPA: hypothetical protein VF789_23210 [Thermoanaerobaculia bacterium]